MSDFCDLHDISIGFVHEEKLPVCVEVKVVSNNDIVM